MVIRQCATEDSCLSTTVRCNIPREHSLEAIWVSGSDDGAASRLRARL